MFLQLQSKKHNFLSYCGRKAKEINDDGEKEDDDEEDSSWMVASVLSVCSLDRSLSNCP